MADNTQLNPGVGGKVMRTLQDSAGVDYPVGAFAYATSIGDGANVLQLVDQTHGLPVEVLGGVEVSQADAAALKATVSLASGSIVAATQSGAWSVGVAGSVTVAQATAANLKATVTQAGPVTVQQATASNLKAEVTIAASQSVGISGPVAVTQSGTWTVNLGSGATIDLDPNAELKLGANNKMVGKISAGADTSALYDGATALQPKFARISASASGNNTIVSAGVGMKIRVLRWGLTAAGDVNVKWVSNSGDLTGVRPLTKYASAGGAYCPVGIFETGGDETLSLHLSDNVAVGGEITYVLVPQGGM